MKKIYILSALILLTSSACTQNSEKKSSSTENTADKTSGNKTAVVFGGCEGCEAIYETPVPFEQLSNTDTLPDFNEEGPKLEISGVIYKKDGITPAPGVVLYIYHTDQQGYYSKKGDETGWGKRHGYIRGWLKSNEKGEYRFYTLRPAHYPNETFPAHIHAIVKETDKAEYWIEDYVFDDDKFVDENYRSKMSNRAGNGVITLAKNMDGIFAGKRDLILGKNISGYPE